jgi:hypothetical protein
VERARARQKMDASDAATKARLEAERLAAAAAGIEAAAQQKKQDADDANAAAEIAVREREFADKQKALEDAEKAAKIGREGAFTTAGQQQQLNAAERFAREQRDAMDMPFDAARSTNPEIAGKAVEEAANRAAKRQQEADDRAAEAAASRKAAADAKAEADRIAGESRDTISAVDRRGEFEDSARAASERARLARQAAQQKAKDAADEERRQKEAEREERDRLPGMESSLDATAAGNRDRILGSDKARTGPNAAMLQDIGKAIGDADTSAEIEKIKEQLAGMNGPTVAAMRDFLASQEKMAKEIEAIRERLKKL